MSCNSSSISCAQCEPTPWPALCMANRDAQKTGCSTGRGAGQSPGQHRARLTKLQKTTGTVAYRPLTLAYRLTPHERARQV